VNIEYGGPEVLRIVDVERPVPADDEVLVEVRATTVNRTEKPSGMPFEEAAAVCDGAILAVTCLRWAKLRAGQRILTYDVVFDAVGKKSFGECKRSVNDGGSYVSTDLGPHSQNVPLMLWTRFVGSRPSRRRANVVLVVGSADGVTPGVAAGAEGRGR
jgi:NADPH:quinone reductase-like Zn-dependent oxidoreductase